MTSYESRRSSAYSEDLQWRIIYQKLALGLSYGDISNNLGISKSTSQRTVSLFLTTGNVQKKSYPTPRAYTKLTSPAKLHILHLVIEKHYLYLDEIQDNLRQTLFINISLATISRFLQKNGFTRLKLTYA